LPGNDRVRYVLQQNGVIWRLEENGGKFERQLFVDLRDYFNVVFLPEGPGGCHECGLYSLAFHPEFSTNGFIYLSYTVDGVEGLPLQSYIARFRTEDGGVSLVSANGELEHQVIYHVEQPVQIHNNGQIKFGADGYLYAGFGDGGVAQNAQDPTNPFGSILRLTDAGEAAPGNLVTGGLAEIFALGLRNPWFWSFDRLTGDLWVGDVGHSLIEEIDLVTNGGNYGWPCFEGLRTTGFCAEAPAEHIAPVWDYGRVDGRSVTGGYVYRGETMPELYGTYIFGDFVSGIIWGLQRDAEGNYERTQLLASGKTLSAFAEDNRGELYVLDYLGGAIYHIAPAEPSSLPPLPRSLAATGCADPHNVTQPAADLLPYDINESFWSDGAEKERFLRLPPDGSASVDDAGNVVLPVGTVLVKNFRLQDRLVETRLLLHQADTGWSGYSYAWDEDQSKATLLDGALDADVGGQVWHFPSRAECAQCHAGAAGFALGLEVGQLNTGHRQLDQWISAGWLADFNVELKSLALPPSADEGADLDSRARSYLHVNCSYCHRPGGTSQSTMDLRFTTHLPAANVCNASPLQGDLGIAGARILVPGDASNSVLWHRISSNGEARMPPLASNEVDEVSAALIREWIDGMEGCDGVVGPVDAAYRIHTDGLHLTVADDLPVLRQADETVEALWQTVPVAERYYRLGFNGYLHYENSTLAVGFADEQWWSGHWEFVPVEDGFRIRNRYMGDHYLELRDGEVQLLAEVEEPYTLWRFSLEPTEPAESMEMTDP
jgi:uncharacterized repeat protein (TIGR03806 family)